MKNEETNSQESSRIDVTLPGDLYQRVLLDAEQDDRTLSEMVRRIVRLYYKQRETIATYEELFAKLNGQPGEAPLAPHFRVKQVPQRDVAG